MTRLGALVERLGTPLLYVFALAACLLGVWIVIPVLRFTAFIQVTLGTIVIGFALSYLLSRPAFPRPLLARLIAAFAGLIALWVWLAALIAEYWQGEMLGLTVDEVVMVALIGVMVGLSYGLFGRGALLFCALPPVALYGLMATNLISAQIIWGFLGVVVAGLNLAGLDYYLSQREASEASPARGLPGHLLLVTAMFAVLVTLSGMGAAAIRLLGSRYRPPLEAMIRDAASPPRGRRVPGSSFLDWLYRFEVASGPVELSPDVVILVRSPQPVYLEARIYDQFSGHAWSSSALPVEASREFSEVAPGLPRLRGAVRVPQSIELKRSANVVYRAAQAVRFADWDLPGGSLPPDIIVDPVGNILPAADLPAETRYSVESLVREFNPSEHHTRVAAPPGPRRPPLNTPFSSEPAVNLARRLTRDTPTLEQKVLILARWVSGHAPYSTEADAIPVDQDVTTYFLEEGTEAYCDVFATVFTIMARGIGIPARLVTGYKVETFDEEQGLYVVRGTDAHAWSEVYLPEQGWVIMDVTPTQLEGEVLESWWQRLFSGELAARNLGLLVGLVALVALSLLLAQRSGWLRLPGWPHPVRVPAGPRGLVMLQYQQACRVLGRVGLSRTPAQTPAEYLRAVEGHAAGLALDAALPVLDALTQQFHRARYSPHRPTDDDAALGEGRLRELRRLVGRRPKKQGPSR